MNRNQRTGLRIALIAVGALASYLTHRKLGKAEAEAARWRLRANNYRREILANEGRRVTTGIVDDPTPDEWLFEATVANVDCTGPLYLGSGTTITHSRIAGGVEAAAGSEGVEVHYCVIGPPQAAGLEEGQ